MSDIKALFASVSQKRKDFNRPVVWLAITSITISSMIQKGETNIEYFFTRVLLGWNIKQFSYFTVADAVIHNLGMGGLFFRSQFAGKHL